MSKINKSYSEKLKDPKWQKRRLEILERDEWACQVCGDKDSTLHVHHVCYEKDKNPWEYKNHQLITLCDFCHSQEHGDNYSEIWSYIKQLQKNGILLNDICYLLQESLAHSDNRNKFTAFISCEFEKGLEEYNTKKDKESDL